ncbi:MULTISPECIES: ankyrin repeat domain-containing protein [unclassified Akkermansia]|jgi:ankyrin repeat protein|nr:MULTISPECIES: ankyrin repeat domain-containing protein [unclassified Akkermansia]
MAGSVLLASVTALMAVPLANAEERTMRLTEEEKQELREANGRLLSLTFRFLYDSWPLDIMSPGKMQEEFNSILQCYQMMEQFRETGRLLLQAPDRNTPLHLCIAMGLNKLAVRMIEAGAPVNAQTVFPHNGTKEPGDTPLIWACSAGIYQDSSAVDRLPVVRALLNHGADPDLPGPGGTTPFMWAAALTNSDPEQEKIALALLDAGSPDLKRRLNAHTRGVGFSSLSTAIFKRLIQAGCDVNERFFASKQSPLHLVCAREEPPERLIPLIELLIKAGADPNQLDVDGLTPLMACNSPEIAVRLMNNGANPSLRNEDGQTTYDFHMKNGYREIAEAIKKWQSAQKKTAQDQ